MLFLPPFFVIDALTTHACSKTISNWTVGRPGNVTLFDWIHITLLFVRVRHGVVYSSKTVCGKLLSGIDYLPQASMRLPQKRKDMALCALMTLQQCGYKLQGSVCGGYNSRWVHGVFQLS